jgi:dolichol-phosphate mannosyltransferase
MKTVDRLLMLRGSVLDRMTQAALPMQFLAYLLIGGVCALINLLLFSLFFRLTFTWAAAATAFIAASAINYWLCVLFLFKRNGSSTWRELTAYTGLVVAVANIDAFSTMSFIAAGARPAVAKLSATIVAFVFNFLGRRFLVFNNSGKSERALENS